MKQNTTITIGLVIGGIFGMLGTFVTAANVRSAAWAIDAVGIIVATSLLTIKYLREENDMLAAGFLVFTIGEAVMLSGTASTLEASVPSFAAGSALWAAGLLLTSLPARFKPAVRVPALIAAVLFATNAARIFCGEQVLPTDKPLPYFAYPFLVLTFAGWIWSLHRAEAPAAGMLASRGPKTA